MPDPLGSLCIVLHGHLPFVLHHGEWPHGEAWLYEAASETYLPLLELMEELAGRGVRPGLTVGLTPVLLEQLGHDRFKNGFVSYLRERVERAQQDRIEFERVRQPHYAKLAARWEAFYGRTLQTFERIGRDIPAQIAAHARDGRLQVLTSNATHAYMPLLLSDEAIRAQMAAGVATTRRVLGIEPRGMWLPECAYRPAVEQWQPPVLYGDAIRPREGLERFIADAGIDHFFVESHTIAHASPLAVVEPDGRLRAVGEAELHWDRRRGWRNPLEPVMVGAGESEVTGQRSEVRLPNPQSEIRNPQSQGPEPRTLNAPRVLARHPRVGEQVWSRMIGYPGSGEYLEFHHKHGERGLRYRRVTNHHTPLGDKEPYDPDAVPGKLFEQAQHFCGVVRATLKHHREQTGRQGIVVAPFDAELFGHWWFEGPQFLRDVLLTLAHDEEIELLTAEEALARHPPDKVARLPEGSWGEGGDHRVWLNDRTRWMWEIEYRAETRLLRMLRDLPWRGHEPLAAMLRRAGRELLLLQASDWPFVIHSGGAVDYGIQRFAGHMERFDRMAGIASMVAAGRELGPVERVQVEECDLIDSVFADVDLQWWA